MTPRVARRKKKAKKIASRDERQIATRFSRRDFEKKMYFYYIFFAILKSVVVGERGLSCYSLLSFLAILKPVVVVERVIIILRSSHDLLS